MQRDGPRERSNIVKTCLTYLFGRVGLVVAHDAFTVTAGPSAALRRSAWAQELWPQAYLLCGVWALNPQQEIKPASPALHSGFFTTSPPEKPQK